MELSVTELVFGWSVVTACVSGVMGWVACAQQIARRERFTTSELQEARRMGEIDGRTQGGAVVLNWLDFYVDSVEAEGYEMLGVHHFRTQIKVARGRVNVHAEPGGME